MRAAANGESTLITTGWARLEDHTTAGRHARVVLPLRATAYRLQRGERLRVTVACADFPRVWPTPLPVTLRVFHGETRIRLPLCPAPSTDSAGPAWGPPQPEILGSHNDQGGSQTWDITRELMTDSVRLSATRTERVRIDASTEMAIEHAYGAAVSAAQPAQARMHSTTGVRIVGPAGTTELLARTQTTAQHSEVEVDIRVDGQPFWRRHWNFAQGGKQMLE